MHYLFALSWRVFDRIIESHDENHKVFMIKTVWSSYLHLSNILLNWVELLNQVVESSFSIQLEFLSSTSQFNSTLFQKNFNLTRHFSSQVLDLTRSVYCSITAFFSSDDSMRLKCCDWDDEVKNKNEEEASCRWWSKEIETDCCHCEYNDD